MDWSLLIPLFISIGIIGGLCIGLVGIGITLVMLPTLLITFQSHFPTASAVKIAIATSVACASIVAMFAAIIQIKEKNVMPKLFMRMAIIYTCTAAIGVHIVHFLPAHFIETLLGIVLIIVAIRTVQQKKISNLSDSPPNQVTFLITMIIAGLSNSICGIATGTIAIPYLSRYYPRKKAVGTSITSTVISCLFSAIGYMMYGWHTPNLPHYVIGYVYAPAFLLITPATFIGLIAGNKLSDHIQLTWFKYILAILVAGTGILTGWHAYQTIPLSH